MWRWRRSDHHREPEIVDHRQDDEHPERRWRDVLDVLDVLASGIGERERVELLVGGAVREHGAPEQRRGLRLRDASEVGARAPFGTAPRKETHGRSRTHGGASGGLTHCVIEYDGAHDSWRRGPELRR